VAALLVVGVVLAAVTVRLPPARPRRWRLAEALMIAGTAPWLYLLLRPGVPRTLGVGGWGPPDHRYHLVPLVDLHNQWVVGPWFFTYQVCGNLLVFAALGFGAPVRWRIGLPRVLLLAAALAGAVEITQYLLHDWRLASVDDVAVNALGAGLAALCSRRWWRRREGPERPGAARPDVSSATSRLVNEVTTAQGTGE
jgi:hypothetical protein